MRGGGCAAQNICNRSRNDTAFYKHVHASELKKVLGEQPFGP
jgi:hypothetical protein